MLSKIMLGYKRLPESEWFGLINETVRDPVLVEIICMCLSNHKERKSILEMKDEESIIGIQTIL